MYHKKRLFAKVMVLFLICSVIATCMTTKAFASTQDGLIISNRDSITINLDASKMFQNTYYNIYLSFDGDMSGEGPRGNSGFNFNPADSNGDGKNDSYRDVNKSGSH